jgi:hypothetical protein
MLWYETDVSQRFLRPSILGRDHHGASASQRCGEAEPDKLIA